MIPTRPAPPPAPPTRPARVARRRLLTMIASVLGVSLLGAASAQAASTIDYDHPGGTITITGSAGEEHVLLSHEGNSPADTTVVNITDFNGSSLTPAAVAAGCVANDPYGDWKCPRPARIVANLGAGNDQFSVYEDEPTFTVPLEVLAGPGDDRIDGASGPDVIHGGDGGDHLTGRGGDDRLYGENGNDTLNGDFGTSTPGGNDLLDGGAGDDEFEQYVGFGSPASLAGNDTYIGGPGNDSFSYFNRADPVSITLDGVANDGKAGETDNIHPDIETVGGSAGNDVIVGSPGNDHLWGSDGDDVIRGLGGNDRLAGDNGNDTIDGGAGNDELSGGCMTDTLVGGPGVDAFYSDAAPFSTCGASLRSPLDRIDAVDGEPDALIFCQETGDQAGDVANVDAIDPVTNSGAGACATINVSAPGGGGGGGNPVNDPPAGDGGGSTTTPLKGTRRAKLGKTLVLLTGTGKKGQAAKQAISRKKKRLTLGTLRATKKTKVTTTATVRYRGRTVRLGRVATTVKAKSTKTLSIKIGRNGLRALGKSKKVSVKVAFKVGKKTYRKTFRIKVGR
ncbi:MAG: calcium-binding protein [Solirubrobacteraceae bacterium]